MNEYIQNENTAQIISKRLRCEYTLLQQDIMELKKQIVLNELKVLRLRGNLKIHENQEIIASKVVTAFKDRKLINIMVLSKTQSGKTGSMCATIQKYLEDTSNLIPIENIYIITGLSDNDWKKQTIERMPESVQSRVFHRCELPNTFADEIKDKQNILIIMDEIQVAAKKGQTIYRTFQNGGLLNKRNLYSNDVKILEYTATPDGTIYDLMKWDDASDKILADVGDGYISSYDLLQQGRVKQYKNLSGYNKDTKEVNETVFENIEEIKYDIDKYTTPLYHIIRTNNGKEQEVTKENFKTIFTEDYEFIKYDGTTKVQIEDINNILKKPPVKHTFIFIKEMLRCAKTLKKEYVGILYERYSKTPDDAAIIQALVGRITGYDDNGKSICYTNVSSIERYNQLWNSNFEDKTIKWHSKTTNYRNGVLCGKNTFNDPTDYDEFSTESDYSDESKEPLIRKFSTQEEAKKYYNKNLKETMGGRGPNKRTIDKNGFYLATIGKGNDRKKVRTTEEIYNIRKWALNETHHYTFYPCYENINDKSTLQWWMIHY